MVRQDVGIALAELHENLGDLFVLTKEMVLFQPFLMRVV
jgi:hypothetical protein